jgi:hypothetical protein
MKIKKTQRERIATKLLAGMLAAPNGLSDNRKSNVKEALRYTDILIKTLEQNG